MVEETEFGECSSLAKLLFQILQPFYVLLQLYMMFKFSNVIVNRSKGTARSLAFWRCFLEHFLWHSNLNYQTSCAYM
jgi:hypothetical protein